MEDYKIKIVDFNEDCRVRLVNYNANKTGLWQIDNMIVDEKMLLSLVKTLGLKK